MAISDIIFNSIDDKQKITTDENILHEVSRLCFSNRFDLALMISEMKSVDC